VKTEDDHQTRLQGGNIFIDNNLVVS